MSTVWEATSHEHGHPSVVAIKILSLNIASDRGALARFKREATIATRLQGLGFPRVFEWGLHEGAPFIAMERLHGETLAERLVRSGPLSLWESLALVRRLGFAVARAHLAGIVHRDVKAQNVFIVCDGSFESIKLLDFGVAKHAFLDTKLTQPGLIVGSPHWMSPQQALGDDVDHRADLWSLGVLVYLCLSGRLPFEGTVSEVLRDLVGKCPARVTALCAGLPSIADDFFARALAKDPRDRFQSAVDMVDAFEAVALAAGPRTASAAPVRLHASTEATTVADRLSHAHR